FLVDQAQGSARHAQTNPTVLALDPETAVLQVRQEPALGFVVGVGNIVPDLGLLARDVADACHEDTPIHSLGCSQRFAEGFLRLAFSLTSPEKGGGNPGIAACPAWPDIQQSPRL